MEAADRDDAYRDSALGIACGQTISQPFVVAYMTEQLQLQQAAPGARDRHRLGLPGRGPVAACREVADHRALPDAGRQRARPAREARIRQIEVMLGDGFDIPAGAGKFDRIIVTAAMEQIPETLLAAAGAGRRPDRAGRTASRRPDAGPHGQDREPASSARSWSTCASCRRCRGSPASCRIADWLFPPTSYSQG